MPDMTSSRPYLVRALIDWIIDNGATPYLTIAANEPGVQVPSEHVKDGKIVLNISGDAIRNFGLDNNTVSFDSRFSGQPFHVIAPVGAIIAVYAKETGQGMAFEVETGGGPLKPEDGSHLKLV